MRPHKIDEKVAEHEQWLERLKRQPDPGQGLVPREAEKARQTHLKHIEGTVGEVERLRAALPPEPDKYPATRAKERILNRRAIDTFPRSESEKKGMRERHEAMRAQEHERETKGKLRKLADRRKHPPDPRATSVLAAVLTSDFVKDALERKLRSGIVWIEDGRPRELADDEYMTVRVFEAQDVAVLYLAALAIEEGGMLSPSTPADRGLHSLGDAAGSLGRLRMNKILTVQREGDRRWRVGWGERASSIAKKMGVQNLPAAPKAEPEEVLTRS
jgi:hypothetical protein